MAVFVLLFVCIILIIAILGYIEKDYILSKWNSIKTKPFEKGDQVFISDLILSPHYNNLVGAIVSDLDNKKKRFAIKLLYHVPEKYITVKPENLSYLTNKKQIESILRNIGINENSKYALHAPSDFINILTNKYRSCSLPPMHKFFEKSFKNYRESCDSVYVIIQYLALFSSINKYYYFKKSFWNTFIDKYSVSNKLKIFAQTQNSNKLNNENKIKNVHRFDNVIRDDEDQRLSILFLEIFNHKLCIIKYENEFRIIQSLSEICKLSLIQELNKRTWLNALGMESFMDGLMDIIHCKRLNRSQWIFGEEIDNDYFDDNGVNMTEQLKICIMEDLNVDMFIKSANKMLKYISTRLIDDEITIKCM